MPNPLSHAGMSRVGYARRQRPGNRDWMPPAPVVALRAVRARRWSAIVANPEGRARMYKVLLFDSWGTLVDNYSMADWLEPHVFEANTAAKIAADWRFQQKWAMFYTTLGDRFVPHPGLTEACLRWALEHNHVSLSEAAIKDLMSHYNDLRAYPDVPGALKKLKSLGLTIKIVANPTRQMLEGHTRFAGIREYIDEIISSGDEAKAFKPSPKVFQLGIKRAGCPKNQILWVTGHFWEIVGADTQGLATAWTNRARHPMLQIGVTPTYVVPHLRGLADVLAREMKGTQKKKQAA
ncbi:MAG: haloacid dehalogenase type II [Alphaproteobacteria bacterium]|nr:haloacid dehalogenase type II [Alphaproteobacteria bacterium]